MSAPAPRDWQFAFDDQVERLDAAHRPSHAFRPGLAFGAWREDLREAIKALLGPLPTPIDPEPVELERTVGRGYVQTKLVFRTAPDVDVPAYLLVPDGVDADHPAPAVLALHGHGGGKGDLITPGIYHAFAQRFAQRGYVVLAPDAPGFGERGERFRRYGGRDGCNINFLKLALFGRNIMALALWDDLRALDLLQARPEVAAGRIGVAGLSFGGTRAMYLAALDDRPTAVVVSGYLTTFRSYALDAGNFCGSQFLPGIYAIADVPDIHGCIAPRPLLIQAGRSDRGFDIEASRQAHAHLADIYAAAGAPHRLVRDEFDGGHEFLTEAPLDFMDRWVRAVSLRA